MDSGNFVTLSIDFIAGSLGGCANVLIGQPLDTVKVKLQTFPNLYRSSFECFRTTLIKDGFSKGLYAGTLPALAANVAENSVLFCAYGFCKDIVMMITKNEGQCKPIENAFAGFIAAFFSSFALCPTELIKCKLQALREQKNMNATAISLTKDVIKTDGFSGLFRGLVPTMAREMPGYFFFFGGYEVSKNILTSGQPNKAGTCETIIAGGIGGICLWTFIFPFDVAKSRIQITNVKKPMMRVMKDIVKFEGILGIYKGLLPTLLRTFPSSGALFLAYEYSKELMTNGSRNFGLL